MPTYYLACDLKDDPRRIAEYEAYHAPGGVWPEVIASLRESGIQEMKIFRTGPRLILAMTVDESFSFARKAKMDQENPKVREWEALMDGYQDYLPWSGGVKWTLLECVFDLAEHG